MAMNVKNRDAFDSSADYCNIYSSQPVNYGDCSHYFPRMTGPDAVLKPPLSLMYQQQPKHFQVMTPTQNLRPPPVMMSPDPLRFPLCTPLAVKMPPDPYIPAPFVVSPKPPEEDGQVVCGNQEAALEELCRPLYCKLCNVTLNSTQQAQAHYQGKNHSKKLRNFYAGSDQPPPIRLAEVEPVSQQPPDSAHVTAKQPLSASRIILATENDYCKLCDASFSSPAVAQAHYQGKNHAKRLRLAEAQQNATSSDLCETQRWPRKEGYECRLMKSRRAMPGPYYNPRPRQRIPQDLAMCVTPSGQFYCSMCNSGASEEAEFRLHLESKQHKSRVSEQRYRSEMEHLGYT
ncbi:zinc finger matrin-type protein 3 [Xyrauchen texanus]|uniref:zinc finger matrin-type protein 3 n=1 Tax=Xyrauchen texanus TaxID=154827 RepID=UPI002242B4C3|nr:zinc finger matrin-type protein 3 [Xyrauchen texanus]